MAAPVRADYLQNAVVAKYVAETFANQNPLQASIDTIWQKILDFYFKTEDNFITETQAYPDAGRDRTKSNVAVTTIDDGKLKRVLILEAKRFPKNRGSLWYEDTNKRSWVGPKDQLQGYMLKARAYCSRRAWNHTMYGIVAVGDRVRFFCLQHGSNALQIYTSPVLSPQQQQMTSFSVIDHSLLIERILKDIATDISNNRV